VSKVLSDNKASLVTPSSPKSDAKAAFVGANTVKGPVPDKVLARPAATTASTKMLKSEVACASSTIFFAGATVLWSSSLPQAVSTVVAAATPVKIKRFLRNIRILLNGLSQTVETAAFVDLQNWTFPNINKLLSTFKYHLVLLILDSNHKYW
jgi:hypothetical protein